MDLVAASGRRYPLVGLVKIGRDPECQVRPPDSLVSRVHAVVWVQDGQARVRDEGSSNGTFVNGSRLPPRLTRALQLGDQVQVGSTLLTLAASTGPEAGVGTGEYETLVEPPVEAPPKVTAPLSAEGAGRPTAAHPVPAQGQPRGRGMAGPVRLAIGAAIGCAVVALLGVCGVVGFLLTEGGQEWLRRVIGS